MNTSHLSYIVWWCVVPVCALNKSSQLTAHKSYVCITTLIHSQCTDIRMPPHSTQNDREDIERRLQESTIQTRTLEESYVSHYSPIPL